MEVHVNIVLITMGSAGDVYPFVGLGTGLKERGHRVTLVTNEYFEPVAREAGLESPPSASGKTTCPSCPIRIFGTR